MSQTFISPEPSDVSVKAPAKVVLQAEVGGSVANNVEIPDDGLSHYPKGEFLERVRSAVDRSPSGGPLAGLGETDTAANMFANTPEDSDAGQESTPDLSIIAPEDWETKIPPSYGLEKIGADPEIYEEYCRRFFKLSDEEVSQFDRDVPNAEPWLDVSILASAKERHMKAVLEQLKDPDIMAQVAQRIAKGQEEYLEPKIVARVIQLATSPDSDQEYKVPARQALFSLVSNFGPKSDSNSGLSVYWKIGSGGKQTESVYRGDVFKHINRVVDTDVKLKKDELYPDQRELIDTLNFVKDRVLLGDEAFVDILSRHVNTIGTGRILGGIIEDVLVDALKNGPATADSSPVETKLIELALSVATSVKARQDHNLSNVSEAFVKRMRLSLLGFIKGLKSKEHNYFLKAVDAWTALSSVPSGNSFSPVRVPASDM